MEKQKAIIVIGSHCEGCKANMITRCECEWGVCDGCAAKCEHRYVRGAIHGGNTSIGVGEYCNKCGRGKPKVTGERQLSPIEHHLAAERELGIRVRYSDGFPDTPQQLVQINRLAKRLIRSRKRSMAK